MKVAAVQLNSTADVAANIAVADRLVRSAADDGAELIVLPEKWTAIGSERELLAAAEPLDGEAITWARALARELGVELVAGSVLETVPGDERPANTSVHIGGDGEIRGVYRKIHMFDVEIDGKVYRESALEQAGEEIVVSQTAAGVELGLSVCYDVRFPELFRIMAVRGARVIALPAAFTLPTTRAHWELLVRARAVENQCFVIAANQTGAHPAGQHSGGQSMVVDPWGTVLSRLGEEGEGHALADLDLEEQRRIRERLPSLENRQPAAYRWPREVTA
ncbi:MAG TPA: carbon-nitrogen hydrolase family protein [Solirubrobacteraceae bacterium]|nr:carbon-nitrogen hydrolase family protein [Solirubrobacteraceae bacterium]